MRCSCHPDREAIGTCVRCGRGMCDECRVLVNDRFTCKNCVAGMSSGPSCKKEPLFALILSFLLPGLGQLYNGQSNRGLYFIIAAIISYLLVAICIGIIIFPIIWIYAMYDAYTSAEKINRGECVTY